MAELKKTNVLFHELYDILSPIFACLPQVRQFDLILSRLIGSVVAEGFDAANARRSGSGGGGGSVARLVQGLREDVGSADDVRPRHVLASLIRKSDT